MRQPLSRAESGREHCGSLQAPGAGGHPTALVYNLGDSIIREGLVHQESVVLDLRLSTRRTPSGGVHDEDVYAELEQVRVPVQLALNLRGRLAEARGIRKRHYQE